MTLYIDADACPVKGEADRSRFLDVLDRVLRAVGRKAVR
jgi:uncharacterized protein YaiI (UPF0178 family)